MIRFYEMKKRPYVKDVFAMIGIHLRDDGEGFLADLHWDMRVLIQEAAVCELGDRPGLFSLPWQVARQTFKTLIADLMVRQVRFRDACDDCKIKRGTLWELASDGAKEDDRHLAHQLQWQFTYWTHEGRDIRVSALEKLLLFQHMTGAMPASTYMSPMTVGEWAEQAKELIQVDWYYKPREGKCLNQN